MAEVENNDPGSVEVVVGVDEGAAPADVPLAWMALPYGTWGAALGLPGRIDVPVWTKAAAILASYETILY